MKTLKQIAHFGLFSYDGLTTRKLVRHYRNWTWMAKTMMFGMTTMLSGIAQIIILNKCTKVDMIIIFFGGTLMGLFILPWIVAFPLCEEIEKSLIARNEPLPHGRPFEKDLVRFMSKLFAIFALWIAASIFLR